MQPATQYNCLCCVNINLCWDLVMCRLTYSEKLGHWGIPDIYSSKMEEQGSVCVYVLIRHLRWSKLHLSHDKPQKLLRYIKSTVEAMQMILNTPLGNACRYIFLCWQSQPLLFGVSKWEWLIDWLWNKLGRKALFVMNQLHKKVKNLSCWIIIMLEICTFSWCLWLFYRLYMHWKWFISLP